jgi:hypothetical protein
MFTARADVSGVAAAASVSMSRHAGELLIV